MELGKHEKQSSLNKNLKEKLTLHPLQHGQQIGSKDLGVTSSLSFLNSGQVPSGDSGTKPLIFTFVPTVRRLPAHSQIVDASKFLAKIEEEPRDENIRETINRSKAFSDSTSTSGIGQGSSIQTTAHYTDTSQKIFQGRRFKSKPEAMEQGDLFKAEYVFIVDSEGEEEATSRNDNKISSHGDNHRSLRPQSLDLPKSPVWGAEVPKKPAIDIHSPSRPELPPGIANQQKTAQQYKIKSSYKAFAAIPTNTLLMEQKALDEPVKKESVPKDDILDPHQELCSPAQLRQQTEELCATIDKVLQDSLHHLESPSSSLQTLMDSDVNKIPSTLQRSAGRETKYANLSLPMSTVGESQLTKPGVIRPAPVKSKIILRKEEEEEPYEPNPFSKYLEDSSGPYAGQEAVSLHPLYQTKLFPPTKLLLPSQTIIGPHCVSPGPFSHLTAVSLSDKHENSHSSFSLKALYNKLSHPIVTIPENEALSSKEQ
ncbi:muscular LMNA-interacting protein isoform X2 [Tachyglossus aculeatus]|uniref:muscular LMNA-interacting protein isoform X2 n=1 Tax=Tachyglossus aculeatus TaxID=9261 RepID=UPI0018F46FD1|nr:muscular LMNA-interacting protein isoform X2 [Tachyglossus aculeatus]